MYKKLKGYRLTMSVLTGFAVVVGGIDPVAAIPIFSSLPFTASGLVSLTLDGSAVTIPGTLSGDPSDPTSFSQFDTLGGTRVLNSVVVTVPASSATLTAFVDPGCDGNEFPCDATMQNTSTFSVGIDAPTGGALDFNLLPLTQMFSSPTATCDSSDTCSGDSDSQTSTPGLSAFNLTLNTPAELNAFIGSGSFVVTPLVALSGAFSVTNDNSTFVSASTDWGGTIEVTFNYTELAAAIPEPASLILLAAGLAALGFARRRRQAP